MGLAYMRGQASKSATSDLLTKVEDTAAFEKSFGCSIGHSNCIQTLIDAKTITIGRLMELVPAGTVDPTPYLYDSTCYAAAGLMAMSLVANLMIRQLDIQKALHEIESRESKFSN